MTFGTKLESWQIVQKGSLLSVGAMVIGPIMVAGVLTRPLFTLYSANFILPNIVLARSLKLAHHSR